MNRGNVILVAILLVTVVFGALVLQDNARRTDRKNAFMAECIEDQTVAKCEVLWRVQ